MTDETLETTVIYISDEQYNTIVEGMESMNNNLYFMQGVLVVFMVIFFVWNILSLLFKRAFD